jgi:hypothetical protein
MTAYTGRIVAICHGVMAEIVDIRVGRRAREVKEQGKIRRES